jgi:hypothetical protein
LGEHAAAPTRALRGVRKREQVLFAPLMRYNHGVLERGHEVCDCSPGPTKCCRERFENRVFRVANHDDSDKQPALDHAPFGEELGRGGGGGGGGGFMAYFQLLGDQAPVHGSLSLSRLAAFALSGELPSPAELPCPAGIARNWTWSLEVPALLKALDELRPTHLVLNMGVWVYRRIDDPLALPWETIARAGRWLSERHNTKLLWRTQPLPTRELARRAQHHPAGLEHSTRAHLDALFTENGWRLYDAAEASRRFRGGAADALAFNAIDGRHLSFEANQAVTRHLLDAHICAAPRLRSELAVAKEAEEAAAKAAAPAAGKEAVAAATKAMALAAAMAKEAEAAVAKVAEEADHGLDGLDSAAFRMHPGTSMASMHPDATAATHAHTQPPRCTALCTVASGGKPACLPLRYILGAGRAGATTLWVAMIALINAIGATSKEMAQCGATPLPGDALAAAGAAAGAAAEDAQPFNNKESQYLLRATRPSARGYARLYRPSRCPSRCFLEGTPYFGVGSTYAQLHALFPASHRHSARFVVVLRDPIARDLSWYRYLMAMPPSRRSRFLALTLAHNSTDGLPSYDAYAQAHLASYRACDRRQPAAVGPSERAAVCCTSVHWTHASNLCYGMYSLHVKHWLSLWRREQMLFLAFPMLSSAKTAELVGQLADFLRLPAPEAALATPARGGGASGGAMPRAHSKPARAGDTSSAAVSCMTKAALESHFAPFDRELRELLPMLPPLAEELACSGPRQ